MSSFNQRECLGCGQPCDGLYCYPCTCQQCRVGLTNGICLNFTYRDGKLLICCECEGPLRGGFCWFCDSRVETSFANDPNLNSFDESQNLSYYPPQPQYETYSYELCGNDSHYGYDCPPRFPLVYKQEPSYNQNDNASAKQKQKLEEMMLELLDLCQEKELYCVHDSIKDLIGRAMNTMLLSINLKSQRLDKEKQEVKNIVEQTTKRRTRITESLQNFKIIHKKSSISLNNTSQISSVIANTPDLPNKELEYSLSMRDEHLSTIPKTESDEVIRSSVKNLVPIPIESEVTFDNESECDVLVNDESSPIFTTFSNHLFDCNDDFISSDDKLLSNEDIPMENFKIYSNPLFDNEQIISSKIDPYHFNVESDLIESLLNRDISMISYPKFDYLLEVFSDELAHINPIPPGIEEVDFDLEEELCLIENLFDSHTEEIDLFLATDDLIPPGIKNDDYDSKRDIHFLDELLSNDSLPLPENESSNFDHHDNPSFPRPPPEQPDGEVFFDFEPDTGVLTTNVVKGISEHYVLMPNILPTLPTLDPNLDFTPSHDSLGSENKIFDPGIFIEVQSERLLSREEFSISFIRDPLYLMFDSLLPFSSENEDKVFKPGILSYFLISHRDKITSGFSENPMMMYGGDIPLLGVPYLHFYLPSPRSSLEASRARGFVHRPLEFQSLAYGNPIS
nr:hypothetical protein [Tanacetum cinerariifolium]